MVKKVIARVLAFREDENFHIIMRAVIELSERAALKLFFAIIA